MKACVLVMFALMTLGCGTAVEDSKAGSEMPSKDEIRSLGGKSDGIDWCDEFGWYGDGICDDFCAEPDPDCEVDCTRIRVIPECGDDELLVDATTCEAAGDDCVTTQLCGVPSRCLHVGDTCPQVVGTQAACPDGMVETEQCQSADCTIERGSGDKCSDVAFCEPVSCSNVPACEHDELEVDAMTCFAAGDECRINPVCGGRAYCLLVGSVCPQVEGDRAACPADSVEVAACSSADCTFEFGSADQCTDVAFCEQTINCLALPSCAPGEIVISTDSCFDHGVECNSQTICGETLHCVEPPRVCPQVVGTSPTCPTGTTAVGFCATRQLNDGSCHLVFGSGDRCSEYKYCAD